MKKLTLLIAFAISALSASSAFADHVRGYYRDNGTYVNGYERSHPDGNPYNNYRQP